MNTLIKYYFIWCISNANRKTCSNIISSLDWRL